MYMYICAYVFSSLQGPQLMESISYICTSPRRLGEEDLGVWREKVGRDWLRKARNDGQLLSVWKLGEREVF